MSSAVEWFQSFVDLLFQRGIPASILLVLALFSVRWLALRFFRQQTQLSATLSKTWQRAIKRTVIVVLLLGLILIWAPQLRTFALSLTAVAVALVIATKELILCVTGSMLRAGAKSFVPGDEIRVGEHRGIVSQQNLLTTSLREIDNESGCATGAYVVVPNSLFLSASVTNLSVLEPFAIYQFTLYLEAAAGARLSQLQGAINTYLKTQLAALREDSQWELLSGGKRSLLASVPSQVRITTDASANIGLVIALPCRDGEQREHEAAITLQVFELLADDEETRSSLTPPTAAQ